MRGDAEFLESLCIISKTFSVDLKSSGWSNPETKKKTKKLINLATKKRKFSVYFIKYQKKRAKKETS